MNNKVIIASLVALVAILVALLICSGNNKSNNDITKSIEDGHLFGEFTRVADNDRGGPIAGSFKIIKSISNQPKRPFVRH